MDTHGSIRHWLQPAILLLGLACLAGTAQAQSLERIKQRGAVTIGYREDASPFSLKDKAGNPAGYAVEICQAVAARLAQQAGIAPTALKYTAIPSDQIERFVRAANVDLFCSATSDTPERRKSMEFSAPIYIASAKVLVRRKDNLKAVSDLGGKTVVAIDKTTAIAATTSYATHKGLAISVAKAVGADAALSQLRLGWVAGYVRDDVLLATQTALAPDGKDYLVLPEPLSFEVIAIAFPPGDAVLPKATAQAMTELYKSGALAAAYDRWFVKPIPPADRALGLPQSDVLKAAWDKLK